jgi:hypothetical protein
MRNAAANAKPNRCRKNYTATGTPAAISLRRNEKTFAAIKIAEQEKAVGRGEYSMQIGLAGCQVTSWKLELMALTAFRRALARLFLRRRASFYSGNAPLMSGECHPKELFAPSILLLWKLWHENIKNGTRNRACTKLWPQNIRTCLCRAAAHLRRTGCIPLALNFQFLLST